MKFAIIAAGEGSRLAKEGITQPKPLVEINGIPLLQRLIDIFCRNNAQSISIIINEEMTEVHDFVKSLDLSVPLNIVIKSTPSSMHSFYELKKYLIGSKFCLTTVDTIFREDEFSAFMYTFENDKEHDGMMAVTSYVDDEKPLYLSVDKETMLIRDFMDSADDQTEYISGGIYCLNSKAIHSLDTCMKNGMSKMRNYQRQLIKDELKLKAYPFKKILDVDHAEDILKAEVFINQKD